MIVHLRHDEVDPAAWDRRLAASANASWYGTRAALDAASPGWNALVDEDSGAQMPLPWRMKYGVRYLFQPFMLQHLGPFSRNPSPEETGRFLEALSALYRYADICVQGAASVPVPGVRTEVRTNHVLALPADVADVRAGYSLNHRRSVQKAGRLGVAVERGVPADRVGAFIEASEQFARWGVDAAQRAGMRKILAMTGADGTGFGRMVSGGGTPLAAGWFVRGPRQVIFLKGVSSRQGRELRAMHALIDDVAAEFASAVPELDLAGGHDPQLARFYSGFGAVPVFYLRALVNRLPPLIRRLKP